MRKYDTIQKIKKEYQNMYENYIVDTWQGGNNLDIYIRDILTDNVICVYEYEFKYKWNLKNIKQY